MTKYIELKNKQVKEMTDLFSKHSSFLVFEFNSLNCEVLTSLRKSLRKQNSRIVVRKNNIIERSLLKTKIINKVNVFGQNAVLFAHDDLNAIQEIGKLTKTFSNVKLKLAYFDKNLFQNEDLKEIVTLKSKPELLSTFAQLLKQPIYQLIFLLNKINNE